MSGLQIPLTKYLLFFSWCVLRGFWRIIKDLCHSERSLRSEESIFLNSISRKVRKEMSQSS